MEVNNPFPTEPDVGTVLRVHIPDYEQDDIDSAHGITQIVDRVWIWYRDKLNWYVNGIDEMYTWKEVCEDIDEASAVDLASWVKQ